MTRIARALALSLGVLGSLVLAPAPALAKDASDSVKPAETTRSDAAALARQVEDSLVKAIANVQSCSVTVSQARRRDGRVVPVGAGSGVVIVHGGKPYVLTNEHVVKGADELQVRTCDGKAHVARHVDSVPQYDIALLAFVDPPKGLRGARFGKSESLTPGQWVIATGNPFFLGSDGRPVATLGVVSGLDRTIPGEFNYPNAIQHDAEVNPGNSGGPLWNLDGELVGINGKIATRSVGRATPAANTGASFSIPIHLVTVYLKSLVDERVKAAAGYAGLSFESAVDGQGNPVGAKVTKVASDCPCRARNANDPNDAGLRVDDVLVAVRHAGRDHSVRTATDYENLIATVPAGSRITLSYLRDRRRGSWTGELSRAR
jgi:S1-C subfamily serine protease